MYLAHYGLNQSPFGITPNPDFFYTGNQRGAILEALIYAVTHGEGIIKVTGEVGSGKTMLCRMLESSLPSSVVAIYLVNPTLGREEVGYAIAGELGLKGDGLRADEVVRLLHNELIGRHEAGQQVVLLVEEAQAMPLDTLEEIRLFSNLETAHHKLLQIVLFGQPELDENLALPRMRQLKERITHSFTVPPLTPALLPEFLMFRMRTAGYRGPDVFTKRAMDQIADVSEGIVRRVSILADKALLAAFADNTHAITARHVKAAVRDSQFAWSRGRRRRRAIIAASVAGLMLLAALGAWRLQRPSATPPATPPAAAQDVAAPAVRAAVPTGAQTAVPSAPVPTAAASAPAVPEATTLLGVDVPELAASRAWLAAQAPQRFTLQVALADPDPHQRQRQLRKFSEEMGAANLHLYPTSVAGQARLALLHGSYASRAEALAMREQLVQEWAYQPQLRTIAGVRAEIRRTGGAQLWPK